MKDQMKNLLMKGLFFGVSILLICMSFSLDAQAAGKTITFKKKSQNITLYTSQKKTLKVSVTKKFRKKKVIFSSSNRAIAKVNKKGVLTALQKGKTTVYAKIKGSKFKAKTKVKVLQSVKSINIENTSEHYYIGKKYYLKATTVPHVTDEKIKWESSNPDIIKVNKKGRLNVKKEGSVTITARSTKTGKKESLLIRSEYVPEIRIKEGKTIFCEYGDSLQLHLEYVNHPYVPMTFSTQDDVVSITPSGYVKTTRPGTVCITAASADKKYKVTATLYIQAKKGFVSRAMLGNLGIDDCTNLMIVAHPDDETLWGGAHLMTGKWFVVCMTSQYFLTRKTEYFNVLNQLGIKGIILDYPDLYKGFDGKWKIDRWNYVQDALAEDIDTIINYKNWDQIVSHSPTGETGHFHHKYVNKAVVSTCSGLADKWNKLWFFGKFYKKGEIPAGLPQITPEELTYKQDLLKLYVREQNSIKTYWEQMNPYENWEKATNYSGTFQK